MYKETWQPQFECIVFLALIRCQQFAPLAHKNMSKTETNDCRLGKSAFCALAMVSDFTTHQHTNKFDVHEGAHDSHSLKMKLLMSNTTVFPDIVLEVPKKQGVKTQCVTK
jgi:hypothetical protein